MSVVPLEKALDIRTRLVNLVAKFQVPDEISIHRFKKELEKTLSNPALAANSHSTLSIIYAIDGDYENMKTHAESAINLNYCGETVLDYALSLGRIGQFQEASKVLQKYLPSFDTSPKFLLMAMAAFLRSGLFNEALIVSRRWATLNPDQNIDLAETVKEFSESCVARELSEESVVELLSEHEKLCRKHIKLTPYNNWHHILVESCQTDKFIEIAFMLDVDEEVLERIEDEWQEILVENLIDNPSSDLIVVNVSLFEEDMKREEYNVV